MPKQPFLIMPLLLLLLVACSGQATPQINTSPTPTPSPAVTPTPTPIPHYNLGDTAMLAGQWELTVHTAKIEDMNAVPYLVIHFTLKNLTSVDIQFNAMQSFSLEDDTGKAYDQIVLIGAPFDFEDPDGKYNAGKGRVGDVAYEIDPEIQTYLFIFEVGGASAAPEQTIWEITV